MARSHSASDGPAEHRTMLADSVADFAAGAGGIARARRLRGTGEEHERAVWKQMAGLGWLGILVPESLGGLGLGLTEMAIVARGLARVLAPEPLTPAAVVATTVLVEADNEALRRDALPRVVAGELLPALAWQEAPGELDPGSAQCRATVFEGGYRLSGVKRFVMGAAQADAFLVSARLDGAAAIFWMPADAAGARVAREPLADGRSFATLSLNDVQLPRSAVAASGAAAERALARAFNSGAVIAGAELVGVMERALDMTLEYLRTRVQFGKPIGAFQALQHRAVDLHIQMRLAEAVLDEALATLDGDGDADSRAIAASRAKARCADAALAITRGAIQLHGAIGFTDDYDAGLYLKRAMTLAAWLGNPAWHRRRYARLALKEAA